MNITDQSTYPLEKARKFQKNLLSTFSRRADAILQLIEALASSNKPTSVVELSQELPYQRTFSNINKSIDALSFSAEVMTNKNNNIADKEHKFIDPALFLNKTREWTNIFTDLLPNRTHSNFDLYVIDATSDPRPHAETLDDRTYVHQASQLGSPITIGLQASLLVAIPEKLAHESKWVLPLSVERVPSHETPSQFAERQLLELSKLSRKTDALQVIALDSGYVSVKPQWQNQVLIARSRIDRTGRRPYNPDKNIQLKQRGRPRIYDDHIIYFAENVPAGDKGGPDEEQENEQIINEREVIVFTSRWHDVSIHGREDLVDVVKVEIFLKNDPSKMIFENPLLLIVSGDRRRELTTLQIYKSYLCRFDIEHFIRFQKQNLLFGGFQTPELQRQINWWWICLMSYWLLYLVREIAPESNRPWMPKRRANMTASPGEVKRVFGSRIFPDLGSPSRPPLKRGKSKGRAKGMCLPKRQRKKVIKKGYDNIKAA